MSRAKTAFAEKTDLTGGIVQEEEAMHHPYPSINSGIIQIYASTVYPSSRKFGLLRDRSGRGDSGDSRNNLDLAMIMYSLAACWLAITTLPY